MRVIFQLPPTGMDPKPERIVTVSVPPRKGETVFYLGYRYVVVDVQHQFDIAASGDTEEGRVHVAGGQIVNVILEAS